MSFLLKLFGSKKLTAVVGGVLALVLTPVLNSKLNLSLDSMQIAEVIGSIALLVMTYVAAQWHIDIKTEGSTTTAKTLEYLASPKAPGPVSPKLATALSVALMFLPEGEAKEKVKEALAELGG